MKRTTYWVQLQAMMLLTVLNIWLNTWVAGFSAKQCIDTWYLLPFPTFSTIFPIRRPLPKKKTSRSVPALISWHGMALIPFSLLSLLLLLLLYYYHTTAILLPFYIICLFTILLHVPKRLFLSRIALKTRILPHKLAFRIPKLNGIMLLPRSEDGTLLRRALS